MRARAGLVALWFSTASLFGARVASRGASCPALSGKGCASCTAGTDERCPGKWCDQPCIYTSKRVASSKSNCMPASWWDAARPIGVTCIGNASGCTANCATPPSPPAPRPPSPPPQPAPPLPRGPCRSDLGCSLNGICVDGKCTCDRPWSGEQCGHLDFAAESPAAGRDLYNLSDNGHNTWNGAIVTDSAGSDAVSFHMYLPLYPKGMLYHPTTLLYGTAPNMFGPWEFQSLDGGDLPGVVGLNPGALVFNDSTTGKTVYSLWISGAIYVADAPAGPFRLVPGSNSTLGDHIIGCSINASPVYRNGSFYCLGGKGGGVITAKSLSGPWTTYATLGDAKPSGTEDPHLWIDQRGHWHALFHAANHSQATYCGSSRVSAHVFSADGKNWHSFSDIEPYKPRVIWAGVGVQEYSTMERPYAYFDSNGRMTHLAVAADINVVSASETGCRNVPNPCIHPCNGPAREQGKTGCSNCKYGDRAATLLIALS